jgi:hypothetical protein
MNSFNTNAGIKKELDSPLRHSQQPSSQPQHPPPPPLFSAPYKRRPSSGSPDHQQQQPPGKRTHRSRSPTRSATPSSSSTYKSRPVKSCTHCRQQKIKCNALETFPEPCKRCAKMKRKCVVDPLFRPQKGGQVALLRDDISSLKQQLAQLQQQQHSTGSGPENIGFSPEDMSVSPQRKYFSFLNFKSLQSAPCRYI